MSRFLRYLRSLFRPAPSVLCECQEQHSEYFDGRCARCGLPTAPYVLIAHGETGRTTRWPANKPLPSERWYMAIVGFK